MISAVGAALYDAISSSNIGALHDVLRAHPNPWSETLPGVRTSALEEAARRGLVRICEELVLAGCPIDVSVKGRTPLTAAASYGRIETAAWLLERGARVDAHDCDVYTPLIAATVEGHLDLVKLMVEKGADVNREHLREPVTALGMAEAYAPVKPEVRPLVDYLRERGGKNPFEAKRPEPWDEYWDWTPADTGIMLVESAFGRVAPDPIYGDGTAEELAIWRSRFKPGVHMLFTSGQWAKGLPELAIALPQLWPLHQNALRQELYRWPIDFLVWLSQNQAARGEFHHGDVLEDAEFPLRHAISNGAGYQWLVVAPDALEAKRGGDPVIPKTFLLVPNYDKPIRAGAEAKKKADAKAKGKWGKTAVQKGRSSLVVPLCYDLPWLEGSWV